MAWRIRRDIDLLRTEAVDRASVVGKCWIEKVEVACERPRAATAQTADPVVELDQLIDTDVIRSEAYRTEALRLADELRTQLPP